MPQIDPLIESLDFSTLIESLSKKVKMDRDSIEEYITLGKLFRLHGDAKKAYKLHHNLLSHPKAKGSILTQIHIELGFDALEAKIKDYGISYFEQCLGWRKRNIPSLLGLARAHREQGNIDQTIEYLQKLHKLKVNVKDDLTQCYLQKSISAQEMSDTTASIHWLQRAIELKPEHKESQYRLVELQTEVSDFKGALKSIHTFIRNWPEDERIFTLLENLFFKKGNYSELESQLKTWIQDDLNSSELFLCLARHLEKKHRLDEAKTCVTQSLEINPKNLRSLAKSIQWAQTPQDLKEIKQTTHAFL